MIDDLREEAIINKVGGRFKLSTLIQKRLVQINAGARPLVIVDKTVSRNANKMQIVIDEIMQDKIFLDTELNVHVAAGVKEPDPLEMDFRNL